MYANQYLSSERLPVSAQTVRGWRYSLKFFLKRVERMSPSVVPQYVSVAYPLFSLSGTCLSFPQDWQWPRQHSPCCRGFFMPVVEPVDAVAVIYRITTRPSRAFKAVSPMSGSYGSMSALLPGAGDNRIKSWACLSQSGYQAMAACQPHPRLRPFGGCCRPGGSVNGLLGLTGSALPTSIGPLWRGSGNRPCTRCDLDRCLSTDSSWAARRSPAESSMSSWNSDLRSGPR